MSNVLKRFLSILMAGALLLGLAAGCGAGTDTGTKEISKEEEKIDLGGYELKITLMLLFIPMAAQ